MAFNKPLPASVTARIQSANRGAFAEPLARSMRGPEPTSKTPQQHDAVTRLVTDQLAALLQAIWRRGDVSQIPFVVGTTAIRLRPAEPRSYAFIQNQSGANQLILGIGRPPGASGAVPVDGLIIAPNFGFFEPLCVPQGELWVVGSGANTAGILLQAL